MAKKTDNTISLISENPQIQRPRLHKLIIKNFRAIGNKPVEIDLDEIVVLVGPNNVGKSTILKAYEIAMQQGSNNGKLTIEDFPNRKIDNNNLPEIELQTILYENKPGNNWIKKLDSSEFLIRERWVWGDVGASKRQGWDVLKNEWSDKVPWGAPNIANARRPEPHKVDAFDSPENQTKELIKLITGILNEKITSLKEDSENTQNPYNLLLSQIEKLQQRIVMDAYTQITEVNKKLTSIIGEVFPDYEVDFDAKAEDDLEKSISFFKSNPNLLVGPIGGFKSTTENQGSGVRRTMLWAILKLLSEENKKNTSERPHLLLIDEPEICLHPNAVREACKVLYDIPRSGNWQVMATTHSPIFIDLSRNNTTIIRVGRDSTGDIEGTTIFRPNKVNLSEDDKTNLKLLNLCDPYVAEFFFGGKVIIVEGDTEYTAFNYIKAEKPDKYKNVHIIRARGKATIVSLIKILNHFGNDYAILHDADSQKTKKDKNNPAWTTNINILNETKNKPDGVKIRLLASLPNFENAYFGEEISKEKPYHALKTISSNEEKFKTIEKLFDSLIDFTKEVPQNCIEWNKIEDLENKVNS